MNNGVVVGTGVRRLNGIHSMVHRVFRCNGGQEDRVNNSGILSFDLNGPDVPTPRGISRVVTELVGRASPMGLRNCASTRNSTAIHGTVDSDVARHFNMGTDPSLVCVAYNTTTSLAVSLATLMGGNSRIVTLTPFFPRCHMFTRGTYTSFGIMGYHRDSFRVSFTTLRGTVGGGAGTVVIGSPGGPANIILSGSAVVRLSDLLGGGRTRFNASVFVVYSRPCHRLTCNMRMPCVPTFCGGAVIYCSFDGSLSLPNREVNCVFMSPGASVPTSVCTTIYNTNETLNFIYTPDLLRCAIGRYVNLASSIRICGGGHSVLCGTLASCKCRYTGPSNTFCLFVGSPRDSTGTFYRGTGGCRLLLIPDSDFNCGKCIHVDCYMDATRVRGSLPTFGTLGRRCGW